jgi:hypothetical protein
VSSVLKNSFMAKKAETTADEAPNT